MQLDITLKNYRCFADSAPATFSIRSGLTAFVGPNNSGKSSLLRFFYEFRSLFAQMPGRAQRALQGEQQGSALQSESDPYGVFCNLNNRNMEVEFQWFEGKTRGDLTILVSRAGLAWTARQTTKSSLTGLLEPARQLERCLYVGGFRNALPLQGDKYFDIQVGSQFVRQWDEMKAGDLKGRTDAALRITDDIRRLFGFKALEINATANMRSLQVIINGKPYFLPELGSGIAHFIVVLAQAAVAKPSFILIDEPELGLHPSLQLDFLTALASQATEGVMFATHSIGLARAAADWIYSLRQDNGGKSELRPWEASSRPSELLGELSFSTYRELGFEKVLLVEGPTDVKTVQQFLRMFDKDHKIVLLPLGGAGLIRGGVDLELDEVHRISPQVYALIDSERSAAGAPLAADRQAFVDTCRKLKIACHVLERCAIENYLSDAAVKAVKDEKYQALQPYQSRAAVSLVWAREENWRIAREMTKAEVRGTDLGRFLESL